jgi:UDP-N-acetylmuramoylalanine--D-glutamate ligase
MTRFVGEIDAFWASLRREQFLLVGVGGLTGASAARLFRRFGVPFRVSDATGSSATRQLIAELRLVDKDVHLGPQRSVQLDGITQVLVSPGVPRTLPLLIEAEARRIPIWCDYDLLYPLFADKWIGAVTGTDGKTTTTSLLAHLLRPTHAVVLAGNNATPVCAAYDELLDARAVVLELSSFMLEGVKRFRANASTVLNVAEDHVDRYRTLVQYAEVKRNVVRYARPTDVFVRNLDDDIIADWELPSMIVRSVSLQRRADAYLECGDLRVAGASLDTTCLKLRGRHLFGDALVALSMAREAGVSMESAFGNLADYPGVPHRFEFIGRWNCVNVIDDSKATSVQAVVKALESLPGRRVVLILGGRDKMLDPGPIMRHAAQLRAIVAYGEAGPRLLSMLGGTALHYVYEFEDAVRRACEVVRPYDTLLLSPACTSFDQHEDYRARGLWFRRLAQECLVGVR